VTDQADFDRLPDDTRKDFARRLSHCLSEVGLLRRDVADMRDECKSDLVGSLERPGVIVRLDRLEQARQRDIATLRWITGGSMTAALVALAAAAKAAGIY
jgi:hypothetical protein